MKRVAFTIILNGLHHLAHHQYAEYLARHLDLWIIVEGAAKSHGSTKWCKPMPAKWHNSGRSVDGTYEYVLLLAEKYHNVHVIPYAMDWYVWPSKDRMVNAAVNHLWSTRDKPPLLFLWQIDADEQWTVEQMELAEDMLCAQGGKTGMFHCDYYVGKDLLARGEWGEGLKLPYRRLWVWEGEYFHTHEPPVLHGGNGPEVLLPQRFQHYAYYFDQDVRFKGEWYGGHEGIYERWLELQKETVFPQPVSRLITGPWGKTKTEIIRKELP